MRRLSTIGEYCLFTGEHTLDDEGSAERQIQSVFDFLEEAEDLDRGCEYWGANPRHSLNVDDEEEAGNVEEPKGESSDDDVNSFVLFVCQKLNRRIETVPLTQKCKPFIIRTWQLNAL